MSIIEAWIHMGAQLCAGCGKPMIPARSGGDEPGYRGFEPCPCGLGDMMPRPYMVALPVRQPTPEAAAAAEKVADRLEPGQRRRWGDGAIITIEGQQVEGPYAGCWNYRYDNGGCGLLQADALLQSTKPVAYADPDADGQVRPMGCRVYGCSVCGKAHADPAAARECCTKADQ